MTSSQQMIITTLRLNREHPAVRAEARDLCAMHSRIGDATAGMPDGGPRVLWATPAAGLLVIRAPKPVTAARLPAGYATGITHREWSPPGRPGPWRMVAVLNPARNSSIEGPTRDHPDRKRRPGPVRLYLDPAERVAWLSRRLAAEVRDVRVTGEWVARGHHRSGRTVTVRSVAFAAVVEVADPDALRAAVAGGVGIDKTWGCGLTLWEPAC